MTKLTFLLAASPLLLGACSSASGPTYSASELFPREGVRTFQVDCHGIFTGAETCLKAARRRCGDRTVHVLESAHAVRDDAPPSTLVFQCDAAPAEAAP